VIWAFIDEHRQRFGVEPLYRVLRVAQSAYRRHAARLRNHDLRSGRARRGASLSADIRRVWQANREVYGVNKLWRQMRREDVAVAVARCTVARPWPAVRDSGTVGKDHSPGRR
jgi:putative transposase